MKKTLLLSVIWITGYFGAIADEMSRAEYIKKYKDLAIKEMKRVGIPASITLAQGLLESGNGNSTLARKANNHFGIKCHDWKGKSIRIDDDRRNECFRKYRTVYESYMDHSEFLVSRSRYAFLFKLPPGDYKRWAHGLKKAGYATDPRYAQRLIKIIREEKLDIFDSGNKRRRQKQTREIAQGTNNEYSSNLFDARLEVANGVHFIVIKKGDTFFSIEKSLAVSRKKLLRYNDLPRDYVLQTGQVMYLHPKKNKAARGYSFHRVKQGDSMYKIAQQYGVKLRSLYRYNQMKSGDEPHVNQKIWLRNRNR